MYILVGSAQSPQQFFYFKKKSAFGLGDRNQKSAKWVQPRIEFCVVPIFRIFEDSIFEKIYWKSLMIFRNLNLDRATAPARDRGRYAGSRASRSGVFHSAPRAPLAPPDVLRHFPVVQPIIFIKVLRCGAAIWFKPLRISEEPKFSDRDGARAGPRALRVIARMEAWFWGTPWMTCLASPDSSGSVSVVLKTLWVKFSRHGGAGRRFKE